MSRQQILPVVFACLFLNVFSLSVNPVLSRRRIVGLSGTAFLLSMPNIVAADITGDTNQAITADDILNASSAASTDRPQIPLPISSDSLGRDLSTIQGALLVLLFSDHGAFGQNRCFSLYLRSHISKQYTIRTTPIWQHCFGDGTHASESGRGLRWS
jgi:hypothetical protein